jgi:tRNA pseudouridine38-40 synthase
MRYFLDLSYRGTAYHGWQSQHNANGVQNVLDKALFQILREPICTTGSGRTDAGVHAEQQMVHFDTNIILDNYTHLLKINSVLPYDIAVRCIKAVAPTAHARYDAIARSYQYRITTVKNPFLQDLAYFYNVKLDLDLMNEGAQVLLNCEDFQSFSKTGSNNLHFLCQLMRAEWHRTSYGYVFHITANRFLYGMVRAIVGTLLELGQGKISLQRFEEIIQLKNRKFAGKAAPAHGLFLCEVRYADNLQQSIDLV